MPKNEQLEPISSASLVIRPSPYAKIDAAQTESALQSLVQQELRDKQYDHVYAAEWCRTLSEKVHKYLKKVHHDKKYKFAVQVVIGEKHGQGMRASSGCLWDEDTDGHFKVVVNKETLYCIVTVFAVYCYCMP